MLGRSTDYGFLLSEEQLLLVVCPEAQRYAAHTVSRLLMQQERWILPVAQEYCSGRREAEAESLILVWSETASSHPSIKNTPK